MHKKCSYVRYVLQLKTFLLQQHFLLKLNILIKVKLKLLMDRINENYIAVITLPFQE